MPRLPLERSWAAACSALAAGLATGWLTAVIEPRGPITTATALLVIGLALVAGFAAGVLTGRRWPVLIGFLGYVAAVEIVRRDLPGPTTDDLRLDSVYGVLAALVTRGFHGLLVLIPMFFAASLTVWFLRRRSADARPGRPVGAAILGMLTVLLAVWVAWPAGTPPVTNPDGSVAEGGVAELATVRVGDSDQVVMIRATDPENPVLLYLSGGPGQSDLALARALTTGWVDDVVFADLDQRGNGKSYAAIDPVSAMTLDRAVDDVIEVSEYLRERFDEPKIYLMGESWGTILGVLAAQRRPTCTTPTSAAARWRMSSRPTSRSTTTWWRTPTAPGTPTWPPG